jgi:hypothetical protein
MLRKVISSRRKRSRVRRYLATSLGALTHLNCEDRMLKDRELIDLVTIAFNTPWVIEEQIRLLEQNLRDPYRYTVLDNSTKTSMSDQIEEICQRLGAGYIRLPEIPATNPSQHHGLALDWGWRNYLRKRQAIYVGFLDHDVFPIKPARLISKIHRVGVYGHQQERAEVWYLWPGFAFFKRELLEKRSFSFQPSEGLDTGGELYQALYRELDRKRVPKLVHRYGKLREGDDPQADWVEYLGDWMHVINASNWKGVVDKRELVERRLGGFRCWTA